MSSELVLLIEKCKNLNDFGSTMMHLSLVFIALSIIFPIICVKFYNADKKIEELEDNIKKNDEVVKQIKKSDTDYNMRENQMQYLALEREKMERDKSKIARIDNLTVNILFSLVVLIFVSLAIGICTCTTADSMRKEPNKLLEKDSITINKENLVIDVYKQLDSNFSLNLVVKVTNTSSNTLNFIRIVEKGSNSKADVKNLESASSKEVELVNGIDDNFNYEIDFENIVFAQ